MPIETRWFLEGRVSYTRLSGEVTAEDIQKMDAWMLACMEAPDVPLIHHIVDAKDVTKPTSARHAMQLKSLRHSRMGWGVTIGSNQNPMVRFLTALVVSVARIRYRDVMTLEEAVNILQAADTSLPKLPDSFEDKLPKP